MHNLFKQCLTCLAIKFYLFDIHFVFVVTPAAAATGDGSVAYMYMYCQPCVSFKKDFSSFSSFFFIEDSWIDRRWIHDLDDELVGWLDVWLVDFVIFWMIFCLYVCHLWYLRENHLKFFFCFSSARSFFIVVIHSLIFFHEFQNFIFSTSSLSLFLFLSLNYLKCCITKQVELNTLSLYPYALSYSSFPFASIHFLRGLMAAASIFYFTYKKVL